MQLVQFISCLTLVGVLLSGVVRGQECTFDEAEDRLCGWHTRYSNDDFSWEVRTSAGQQKTGPDKDRSGKGYFMIARSTYTEGGSQKLRPKGSLARLASPMITTNNTQIFRFWYYMYGRHVGSLKVYILINGTGNLNQVEWVRYKNKGARWILGEVRLPVEETFRIVIEASVGNGVFGDIAVDQFTVLDMAYDCTFEDEDLCQFTQEKGDHFDWTVGRGKTPTRRTGPRQDHTYATPEGTYMYIEATGPRKDTKALLISQEFTKQPGPCTVSFFYHMYGAFIGELAIHVKWAATGKTYGKRRWTKAGNQGNSWIGAEFDISDVEGKYQVVFEATRGRSSAADIAIDDFKLLGKQCTDFDDCVDSPCLNNGTCVDSIGSYNCTCPSGYDGKHCEEECVDLNKNCPYWSGIGECERNPKYMLFYCKKSCAQCVDIVCRDTSEHCPLWAKTGECKKNPYYMLANCQRSCKSCIIDIDDCESSPCENGGTCVDGDRSHNCTCPDAYEGDNCELEVDECSSPPCQNGGTCMDGLGHYNCSCPVGWTGDNCEIDIDDCQSNPCQNSGTCVDMFNDYNCTCVFGYAGHDCEMDSDECASSPCQNEGTCTDIFANYTCECMPGWKGRNCEIDVDECLSEPCQNGGTCYHGAGLNIYLCHCTPGWEGTNCESDFDECASNPCINGATCYNGKNMYNCTCPDGWQGNHCESDVNECLSSPCKNGGSCFHSLGEAFFVCACTNGWEGELCEIESDECVSNPCQYNATCTDLFRGFNCTCTDGYTGTYCEQRVTFATTESPTTTTTLPTTKSVTTAPATTMRTTTVETEAPTTTSAYQTTSTVITTTIGVTTKATRTDTRTTSSTDMQSSKSSTTLPNYSGGGPDDDDGSPDDEVDEFTTVATASSHPQTPDIDKVDQTPKTFERKVTGEAKSNAGPAVIAIITVTIIAIIIGLVGIYVYVSRKKQNDRKLRSDRFTLTDHDGSKRHSQSSTNSGSDIVTDNSMYGAAAFPL